MYEWFWHLLHCNASHTTAPCSTDCSMMTDMPWAIFFSVSRSSSLYSSVATTPSVPGLFGLLLEIVQRLPSGLGHGGRVVDVAVLLALVGG
jgi:hypothetical protein